MGIDNVSQDNHRVRVRVNVRLGVNPDRTTP